MSKSGVNPHAAFELEEFDGDSLSAPEVQAELQYRLTFEKILLTLAKDFIHLPLERIDEGIQHTLDTIATFVDVDRCYLFQYRDERQLMDNTHEWSAPGVEPHRERLQSIVIDRNSRFIQTIESNEVVHIPQIANITAEEFFEKEEWELEGIQSLVCVPLLIDGTVGGFLGFDSVREAKHWSKDSVSLLTFAGSMLGSACARERTERRKQQLEEQILHSQKLESLGVLAGGIAHDFNNLLMGLIPSAEMLLKKLPKDFAHYAMLERMHRASIEASELTRQLLSYAGRGSFESDVVDLNELLVEMKPLLCSAVKNVSIEYTIATAPQYCLVDPTQIRQVLLNLATNAAEAVGENDGCVSIKTDSVVFTRTELLSNSYLSDELAEGSYCVIEVKDNGSGFETILQDRIFDPFYSTKFPGRGLGLAVVLGIVRAHNGAIHVQSEPGEGAIFRVLLPASEQVPSSVSGTSTAFDKTEMQDQSRSLVLVVDDQELTRVAAGDMLECEGYSVMHASNGTEGLSMLQRYRDELLVAIVDMTMPEMNGTTLCAQAKADGCGVPIILSSGYSEEEAAEVLEEHGFASFLQKPYGPEALQQALKRALCGEKCEDG